MDATTTLNTLKRAIGRALRSDFGRDNATEEERASLSAASTAIEQPLAQDYAAWRSSVLLLAAVVMALGAVIQLINFETFSGAMIEGLRAGAESQGGFFDEGEFRRGFGEGNLDTLDSIFYVSMLAMLVVLGLTIGAARAWRDVRRSARMARWAWFILVGTPLVLAVLPWSRMLDFSHLGQVEAEQVRQTMSLGLGLLFFGIVGPKLLSVFPGIMRASVTLKTLLHESPVPGYVVVLFAPVYAMFIMVVFTTVIQIEGSLVLLGGVAFLVVAPLVYLWRGRQFLRPHSAEESVTLVRGVRKQAYLFNLIGLGLLGIFFLNTAAFTVLDALEFAIHAGGGVFLMVVVAADFFLGLLRLEHAQAKDFVGSEMADVFEDKLASLAEAGFGQVSQSTRQEPSEAGSPR